MKEKQINSLAFFYHIFLWKLICLMLIIHFETESAYVKAQIRPITMDVGDYPEGPSPLNVIGKGDSIRLMADYFSDVPGLNIQDYNWSIINQPVGASDHIGNTNSNIACFRPGSLGDYVIKLALTTSIGIAETTITIKTATYVGVGSINNMVPNLSKGQCASCHKSIDSTWHTTDHSDSYTRLLKNTGYDCKGCHTVGYDVNPLANNGGIDDVLSGDMAALTNIQCENCHGPGSRHKGDSTNNISISLRSDLCLKCHYFPSHRATYVPRDYTISSHSKGIDSASQQEQCSECHSAFQAIYKLDSSKTKYKLRTGEPQISCQVCHDSHNSKNHVGLETDSLNIRQPAAVKLKDNSIIVSGGRGKLCMTCHHSSAKADTTKSFPFEGPHFPQADMLSGTNVFASGKGFQESMHLNLITNSCVQCHMTNRDGGHTFKPSLDACTECHPGYDEDSLSLSQNTVKRLLSTIAGKFPMTDTPIVKIKPSYTSIQRIAAYNYLFVNNDGSYGIHNYSFTLDLLRRTDSLLNTEVSKETSSKLNQNSYEIAVSPNPFSQFTKIVLHVSDELSVKLTIHDVKGVCIKILAHTKYSPSEQGFEWNGSEGKKDGSGSLYLQDSGW